MGGTSLGAWKAKSLGKEPEGIAVAPTSDPANPTFRDVWVVDREKKKVFFFNNAAGRTSGEYDADSSFALNSANTHPKGIATNGVSLWVVDDDGGREQVFKYNLAGQLLGNWEIADAALEEPTGITLDPAGGTTLWIVDKKSDKVYQFDNATGLVSGSKASDATFALAAENGNPQGIADPIPFVAAAAEVLPFKNPENRYDVNGDGGASPQDLLSVINTLNAQGARLLTSDDYVEGPGGGMLYFDISGDGLVTSSDVLLGVNFLNGFYEAAPAIEALPQSASVDGQQLADGESGFAVASEAIFAELGSSTEQSPPAVIDADDEEEGDVDQFADDVSELFAVSEEDDLLAWT